MGLEPYREKWQAFGWGVRELDGHDVGALLEAFAWRRDPVNHERPVVLVCRTVKGKGVSYMEDVMEWHASPINREQRDQAIAELEAALAALRQGPS